MRDPVWCHAASRFKFTKLLQKQTHVFDRAHFTVSVDPMRVVTVPNTVNGKTGLVCTFIGSTRDLERSTISEILDRSKTFPVPRYPELLENPLSKEGGNGAMKSSAKNPGEGSMARVTAMTPSPTLNHSVKKCPKCGAAMKRDKQLASGGELTLRRENEFIGDDVLTFYCPDCGFIELYRTKL